MPPQRTENLLASKLLEYVYQRYSLAFWAGMSVSGVLVIALWPLVEHKALLAWLLALWLVMSVRHVYVKRYLRLEQGAAVDQRKWRSGMLVGLALTGACWGGGVIGIAASPLEPAAMLMLFVLAGVTAFACISLAAVPAAALAFLLPALLPPALWLFSFGERLGFFMGGMALGYLGLMLLFSRRMHHTIRGLFSANERNKALQEQVFSVAAAVPGFLFTIRVDVDGHAYFPFASAGVEDMFGLRPEDIRADAALLRARYHPGDALRIGELMRETERTLAPFRSEIRINHPHKGERWIEIRSTPQRQSDGATEWHGLMIDITERKQMQEALDRRERDFRSLAENLPVAVIRYDSACCRRYVNPAAERMLHGTAAELLGHVPGASSTGASSVPATPSMIDYYRGTMEEVLAAGAARELVFVLDALPVERREYYEVRFVPEQGADEQKRGVLAIWYDLTERKRAQQRMELLDRAINQTSDAVYLIDEALRFTYVNQAACRSLGYAREELLTMGPPDIDPDITREFAMKIMKTTPAGHQVTFETRHRAKDGHVFPVELNGTHFEDGGAKFSISVVRDITARKEMELAREAALSEALRLGQMRSAFMARMSHELRTPLNGILGYAQNLQLEGGLSEKLRSGLGVIQRSGDHLLALLNEVLDHAKIEADKLELHIGSVDLEALLHSVIELIRARAEQKKLAFVCRVAADLPAVIRGDEQRLRQVLLNLLSNAVKFTERGQVTLGVSRPAPARIRFEVRDSGIGIPANQLETIFLPFEQAGAGCFPGGGTGLGLAISRKLAQLMGGDIAVESQPGEGSTFSCEVDLEIEGAEALDVSIGATPVAEAAPSGAPLFAPPRQELESLYGLAQRGNMRNIERYAASLAEMDERYAPFAAEVSALAKGYRSKAILELVEQHLARQAPGV